MTAKTDRSPAQLPQHAWGMDANFRRHVKIVATLGPAVADPENLASIIDAGVDMVRINCAHGTPESRAQLIHTGAIDCR